MSQHEFKFFPLDQLDRLEAAIAELVRNKKTRALGIACALGLHGCRVSEITRALAKHFDPLARTLYVCPYNPKTSKCQPLKKGKPRTIELHSTLVDAIRLHREELSDTAKTAEPRYLLPTRKGTAVKPQKFSDGGRALLLRLGMADDERTRFHCLRHTSAMRVLADSGNDLQLVQYHLGHRSIQTTMIYLARIRRVPTSCLVKLHDTPAEIGPRSPQLTLFNPHRYQGPDDDRSQAATG